MLNTDSSFLCGGDGNQMPDGTAFTFTSTRHTNTHAFSFILLMALIASCTCFSVWPKYQITIALHIGNFFAMKRKKKHNKKQIGVSMTHSAECLLARSLALQFFVYKKPPHGRTTQINSRRRVLGFFVGWEPVQVFHMSRMAIHSLVHSVHLLLHPARRSADILQKERERKKH